MASLGESVIAGAQNTATNAGRSIGDAVQAYHIAATAENARQQLDIQKQENERNKGNWLAGQMANIGKYDGSPETQKILIEGLKKQVPLVIQGTDPAAFDLMFKDADIRRSMTWASAKALQDNHITPDSIAAMTATLGSPQAVAEAAQKIGEGKQKIEAQRVGGQAMRAANQQDSNTERVAHVWDADPNVLKLLNIGQPLGRDMFNIQQARREGKPVTYQMLAEAIQSTSNALAPGSGVSDFRVKEITPHVSDKFTTDIMSLATNNPNRPATPEYQKYVEDMLTRTFNATRADIGVNADRLFSGIDRSSFNNPQMYQMHKSKHDYLKSGRALMPPDVNSLTGGSPGGQGQTAMQAPQTPQAPPAAPPPAPSGTDPVVWNRWLQTPEGQTYQNSGGTK